MIENMNMGLTVPKWVLIVQLKMPQIYLPNLSAQAQKFGISMKKGFIGVRSRCLYALYYEEKPTFIQFIFDDSKIVCSIVLNIMQG